MIADCAQHVGKSGPGASNEVMHTISTIPAPKPPNHARAPSSGSKITILHFQGTRPRPGRGWAFSCERRSFRGPPEVAREGVEDSAKMIRNAKQNMKLILFCPLYHAMHTLTDAENADASPRIWVQQSMQRHTEISPRIRKRRRRSESAAAKKSGGDL